MAGLPASPKCPQGLGYRSQALRQGTRGEPAGGDKYGVPRTPMVSPELQGAVDEHSSDQLLLPLAVASGPSRFHVPTVTSHLLTNAQVIQRFVPASIVVEGAPGSEGVVAIAPA